ncbi:MAG: inner-rane translocator [Frankiales bacterium]|nr:inner-rane translocator [Frankiales bacterium]
MTRLNGAPEAVALRGTGITKTFGGVQAVLDVNVRVDSGTILGVIGPNGAGKSTLLGMLSGVIRADLGQVQLGADDLSGGSPLRFARAGIRRTFQQPVLAEDLNAIDNVRVATERRPRAGSRMSRDHSAGAALSAALLASLGIENQATLRRRVRDLPYGLRRLVELARAMAGAPRFVLLDEPAAGLGSDEVLLMSGLLADIAQRGIGLVVVDHNVRFVADLSTTMIALSGGRVIADGTPEHVLADESVVSSYLGQPAARHDR